MDIVQFESSGSMLTGYFFPARTTTEIATVIFLQGFPGIEGDELICQLLANEGIHTLTFNYRGMFKSEGYFSFRNALDDVESALNYVIHSDGLEHYRIDPKKIILGGWSFGAALIPSGMVQNPGFKRGFMISGRNFAKEAQKIQQDAEYARQVQKNLDGLPPKDVRFDRNEDLISGLFELQNEFDHEKLAPKLLDSDLFLVGGWDDDVVPVEDHLLPLYRALKKNGATRVRVEVVQDDHEFSNTREYIVQILLEWLKDRL